MTSWLFLFKNTFILRRAKVTIFDEIMKIVTMCIKKIFKKSKQVNRIRSYVSKCNLYLYCLEQQNLLISGKKMLISPALKGWCSLGKA